MDQRVKTLRQRNDISYPFVETIFQYFCSTELDNFGYAKLLNWGWCSEDCPLEGSDDSTWGTDETLTVTTYFIEEFDDIYMAIAIVTGAFISIPLIGIALRRYGLNFKEYDV